MLSVYKISKGGFKSIFAMEINENPNFYFFIDGNWISSKDDVDVFKMIDVYGTPIDSMLLADLDIGSIIDMCDGGKIKCLANFKDLEALEHHSKEVIEFLSSNAKLSDLFNKM